MSTSEKVTLASDDTADLNDPDHWFRVYGGDRCEAIGKDGLRRAYSAGFDKGASRATSVLRPFIRPADNDEAERLLAALNSLRRDRAE